MAKHQLARIAEEVVRRARVHDLVLHHRIGRVAVGEASLYLRRRGAHRREAFAGAIELIERLKQDVPIWKHPYS